MSVGDRLRDEYGLKGILTLSPEQGGITELLCDMDTCYCPRGRGHFERISQPLGDWMPTLDHHPKLRMFRGTRKRGNVRLAHRACNRLGFGHQRGHLKQRLKAAVQAAEWHKDNWEKSAAGAKQRGEWETAWRAMRGAASSTP